MQAAAFELFAAATGAGGVADDCPADVYEPVTTECRASAGACDVADYCNGASAGCTVNVKLTSECRASAGICDVAEV